MAVGIVERECKHAWALCAVSDDSVTAERVTHFNSIRTAWVREGGTGFTENLFWKPFLSDIPVKVRTLCCVLPCLNILTTLACREVWRGETYLEVNLNVSKSHGLHRRSEYICGLDTNSTVVARSFPSKIQGFLLLLKSHLYLEPWETLLSQPQLVSILMCSASRWWGRQGNQHSFPTAV